MTDEPVKDREDEAEPGGNHPDEDYANAGDESLPSSEEPTERAPDGEQP